jgi:hypothetical protein
MLSQLARVTDTSEMQIEIQTVAFTASRACTRSTERYARRNSYVIARATLRGAVTCAISVNDFEKTTCRS